MRTGKMRRWFTALLMVSGCMADPNDVDTNVGPYDDGEVLDHEVEETASEEIGSTESPLSSPESRYPKSLVRLDFTNGRCSGFLIAPNMIAAASRCLVNRREAGVGGNWRGMNWGHVRLRIVYKPSEDESMCLNEPCRNANGSRRYTTVALWWDEDYDTGADDGLAILTRVQGNDYQTRPGPWNGPTPRALSDARGDFLRILKIDESSTPRVNNYGAGYFGDDEENWDYIPRRGRETNTYWLWSEYGRNDATGSPLCDGDEGGPAVLEIGPQNSSLGIERNMAVGAYSHRGGGPGSGGRCGAITTSTYWTRLDAKQWMIEEIMDWADRPGSPNCRHYGLNYSPSRVARYLRCW